MAKIHALSCDLSGNYNVILHTPMPGGIKLVTPTGAWRRVEDR